MNAAKKNTQFFTTYDPEFIMDDLHKELLQMDGITNESIKHHPGKWRVDFSIAQHMPSLALEEELETNEETKQQVEDEIVLNSSCTVKLLQVEGEKLAVEFSKSSGSQTVFIQTFMQLADKLADLNNVAE